MPERFAPHATDSRARALRQVGDRYPAGWCLRWAASVFGVPGVGDWDHDRSNDAEDFWKAAVARGDVVKTSSPSKIPAGVMILWTGGSHDHGHAAYSLGNGEMVSTDLPHMGRIGRVKISEVHRRWGLTLVGYIKKDGNGYILKRAPGKTVKTYKVTTAAGLNGRKGPSKSAEIVRVAEKGDTVKAVKLAHGDGYVWAVTESGVHYAVSKGSHHYMRRV